VIRWASETGPSTAKMVELLLSRLVHPEQGYRRCVGLISLSKQYGADRVELACRRALAFQAISYQSVKLILKNNLDSAALPEQALETPPLLHENIRGAAYYASEGLNGADPVSQLSLDIVENTERNSTTA
jgi:hypothetical protein